ncbi:hypothetical protein C1I97_32445, partial [Streptomyces sp. NTH33]
MSGIGPLEPGEGTCAWDAIGPDTDPEGPDGPSRTRSAYGPIARFHERHRRAALVALALVLLLAGGSYLYATRRHTPPPARRRT